jgi:hypothetical protein
MHLRWPACQKRQSNSTWTSLLQLSRTGTLRKQRSDRCSLREGVTLSSRYPRRITIRALPSDRLIHKRHCRGFERTGPRVHRHHLLMTLRNTGGTPRSFPYVRYCAPTSANLMFCREFSCAFQCTPVRQIAQ